MWTRGVILKSLLKRILDLEGAVKSLREENHVLRSETPSTGVLPSKASDEGGW